jgi:hypothetical protein
MYDISRGFFGSRRIGYGHGYGGMVYTSYRPGKIFDFTSYRKTTGDLGSYIKLIYAER